MQRHLLKRTAACAVLTGFLVGLGSHEAFASSLAPKDGEAASVSQVETAASPVRSEPTVELVSQSPDKRTGKIKVELGGGYTLKATDDGSLTYLDPSGKKVAEEPSIGSANGKRAKLKFAQTGPNEFTYAVDGSIIVRRGWLNDFTNWMKPKLKAASVGCGVGMLVGPEGCVTGFIGGFITKTLT